MKNLLDVVVAHNQYADFKDQINYQLEIMSRAGIYADNNDNLFLSRYIPILQKCTHASQALSLFSMLNKIFKLDKPFEPHSPRSKAFKLLDSLCPITTEPLLIFDMTHATLINAHTLEEKKIYLDETNEWFTSANELVVGENSPLNYINADGKASKILPWNGVDYDLINAYQSVLIVTHKLIEKNPELISLPEHYFKISCYEKLIKAHETYSSSAGILFLRHIDDEQFSQLDLQKSLYASMLPYFFNHPDAIRPYLAGVKHDTQFASFIEPMPFKLVLLFAPHALSLNLIKDQDYLVSAALAKIYPKKVKEIHEASLEQERRRPNNIIEMKEELKSLYQKQQIDDLPQANQLLIDMQRTLLEYEPSTKENADTKQMLLQAIRGGFNAVIHALDHTYFTAPSSISYYTNRIVEVMTQKSSLRTLMATYINKIKELKQFIVLENQKKQKKQVTYINMLSVNTELLQAVLADKELKSKIKPRDLKSIFLNSQNKDACAKVLLMHYNAGNFPGIALSPHTYLNYFTLKNLFSAHEFDRNNPITDSFKKLDAVNYNRARYGFKSIIPADAEYALTHDRHALSKEELYQLIDTDITVGEYYLRNKYAPILLNNNTHNAANIPANIYFYLLSIQEGMLLPPEEKENKNYPRYTAWKLLLRSYVDSINPHDFNKPVVIAGIANVNGNHYIPYFLHKNKFNQISILTVDPSPQNYHVGEKNYFGQLIDGKEHSLLTLQKIFLDIFPNGYYYDPNITQQLKQRDCGFNSFQTIEDVLQSAMTENPLLTLRLDGNLYLRCDGLTINGNNWRGFNFDINRYYYANQFVEKGKENRRMWSARFSEVKMAIYYMNQDAKSIYAKDHACALIEYSYQTNVEQQKLGDDQDEAQSLIAAAMLANESIWIPIQNKFAQTLKPLSVEEIDALTASVTTVLGGENKVKEILPANQSLPPLLVEIANRNLRDLLLKSLLKFFSEYCAGFLIRLSEDISGKDLYESFISHPDFHVFCSQLNNNEKSEFRSRGLSYANNFLKKQKRDLLRLSLENSTKVLSENMDNLTWLSLLHYFKGNNLKEMNFKQIESLLATSPQLLSELRNVKDRALVVSKFKALFKAELHMHIKEKILAEVMSLPIKNIIHHTIPFARPLHRHPFATKFLEANVNQLKTRYIELRSDLEAHVARVNLLLSNFQIIILDINTNGYLPHYLNKIKKQLRDDIHVMNEEIPAKEIHSIYLGVKKSLENTMFNVATYLRQFYKEGEMKHFHHYHFRHTIAELLTLHASPFSAIEFDLALQEKIGEVIPINYKIQYQAHAFALPNHDNVVLTGKYLCYLLQSWYKDFNSRWSLFNPPAFIQRLQIILGNITDLTSELGDENAEKVNELIQRRLEGKIDFTKMHSGDATQNLLLMLANTVTLAPYIYNLEVSAPRLDREIFKAPPSQLAISRLEYLLDLYQGKQTAINAALISNVVAKQILREKRYQCTSRFLGWLGHGTGLDWPARKLQLLLLSIRNRHNKIHQEDFYLDYADLQMLRGLLAEHHHMFERNQLLISSRGLYWAAACLLANTFASYGELKSPLQFFSHHANVQLKTMQFPKVILDVYGFEDACITEIDLKNVVILPTGYAIDYLWIKHLYHSTGKFVNPYTQEDLSREEFFAAITQSPDLYEFIQTTIDTIYCVVSAELLAQLKSLVSGMLIALTSNEVEEDQYRAIENFNEYLNTLSASRRKMFLNIPIPQLTPNENVCTLGETIHLTDTCVRYIATRLARLIYQYERNLNFLSEKQISLIDNYMKSFDSLYVWKDALNALPIKKVGELPEDMLDSIKIIHGYLQSFNELQQQGDGRFQIDGVNFEM